MKPKALSSKVTAASKEVVNTLQQAISCPKDPAFIFVLEGKDVIDPFIKSLAETLYLRAAYKTDSFESNRYLIITYDEEEFSELVDKVNKLDITRNRIFYGSMLTFITFPTKWAYISQVKSDTNNLINLVTKRLNIQPLDFVVLTREADDDENNLTASLVFGEGSKTIFTATNRQTSPPGQLPHYASSEIKELDKQLCEMTDTFVYKRMDD